MCKIKAIELVKSQDLFGAPVQLTYKGERAFNTVSGGCCSLLLIMILICAFCVQLYSVYFSPQFLNYPPRQYYDELEAHLYPRSGNTIAVSIEPDVNVTDTTVA